MPVGAFGGRRDMMEKLAPLGPVYQAGTLSGNPVAMAAGMTTLELISVPGFHERSAAMTDKLVGGLRGGSGARRRGARDQSCLRHVRLFLHPGADGRQLCARHGLRCAALQPLFPPHAGCGLYFAPSAFEAGFLSSAHTREDIETTIRAAQRAFAA